MSASGPSPDINTWRGEPCRGSRNGPVWKPYRLIRGMSDKSTYALVKATSSGFRQCRSARGSYRRSLDRRPDRRSFWWRGSARRPRSPQRAGWTRESVTLHRGRDRTWRQDGQSRRQRHHGRGQSLLLLPVAVRPFIGSPHGVLLIAILGEPSVCPDELSHLGPLLVPNF